MDFICRIKELSDDHKEFAEAFREWCINYRHKKDLQWKYAVEREFDDYKYLTNKIIQEIEFATIYSLKKDIKP
jgi:hypothetical protein